MSVNEERSDTLAIFSAVGATLIFSLIMIGFPERPFHSSVLLPEQIKALQIQDTRPQWLAYLASLGFAALAFASAPLLMKPVQRIASTLKSFGASARPAFSSLTKWVCSAGANEAFRRAVVVTVFVVAGLCLALAAYLFAFHRNDFSFHRTDGMNAADPHAFIGFVELGDQIWRLGRWLPQHIIVYGLGMPLGYAALKSALPSGGLDLVFGFLRLGNLVFLLVWAAVVSQAGRLPFGMRSAVILLIACYIVYGVQMLLTPTSPAVVLPMLSGWRFMPFLAVLGYAVVARNWTSAQQSVGGGLLCALLILMVPETGAIAALATAGYSLSGSRVSLRFVAQGVLFFGSCALALAGLFFACDLLLGSHIAANIASFAGNFGSGYAGIRLRFAPLSAIMAIHALYVACRLSFRLHFRPLAPAERFQFVAALLLLGWFSYFMYRPFPPYAWVYFFMYGFVLIPHVGTLENFRASVGASFERALSVCAVAFLVVIALSPFHGALYKQLQRASQHQPTARIGGITTVKEWADSGRARVGALSDLLRKDSSAVVVTSFPLQVATLLPPTLRPLDLYEIYFTFPSYPRIDRFIAYLIDLAPEQIVFDQTGISKMASEPSDKMIGRFEKAISSHYRPAFSNDYWRVWRHI